MLLGRLFASLSEGVVDTACPPRGASAKLWQGRLQRAGHRRQLYDELLLLEVDQLAMPVLLVEEYVNC